MDDCTWMILQQSPQYSWYPFSNGFVLRYTSLRPYLQVSCLGFGKVLVRPRAKAHATNRKLARATCLNGISSKGPFSDVPELYNEVNVYLIC